MISESEKARRIALGRHAGAFLRALAGDRKGVAAMVCREIGGALLRSAVNVEGAEIAERERVTVVNVVAHRGATTFVHGGDA